MANRVSRHDGGLVTPRRRAIAGIVRAETDSTTSGGTTSSTDSTTSSTQSTSESSASSTISSSSSSTTSESSSSTTSIETSSTSTSTSTTSDTTLLTTTSSNIDTTSVQHTEALPTPTTTPPPALPTTTSSISFTTTTSQATTISSPAPTSLSSSVPSRSSQNRTAIIAGATTAGILLLLGLLGAVFMYRRHQIRRQFDAYFHRPKREGRGLLDGEEFDDDDEGVPMRRYRDASGSTSAPTTRSVTPQSYAPSLRSAHVGEVGVASGSPVAAIARSSTPQSQAPSQHLVRVAETGSVFRENISPPPGKQNDLVDVGNIKSSGNTDLTSIVDDVMGPAAAMAGSSTAPSTSSTVYTPLDRTPTNESLYTDPFRDASRATTSASVYYALPPGASPASTPGASSSAAAAAPPPYNLQPAGGPNVPLLGLPPGTAQPRTSSPLARALSSASSTFSAKTAEPKLWIGRKVRGSSEGSES